MPAPTPDHPVLSVLVVEDDPLVAGSLAQWLRAAGHQPTLAASASDAREALAAVRRQSASADRFAGFHAALCDLGLPGGGGAELIEHIAADHPATGVIVITGHAAVASTVASMRAGAADYLIKPVSETTLRRALDRAVLRHEMARLRAAAARGRGGMAPSTFSAGAADPAAALLPIVGDDPRMKRVLEMIDALAPARTTVLMAGESGVGKSLIARAIHDAGPRRHRPFIELACGSIPETLLESELFGHVKGAFTGAHADKIGRFLAADGGTLFLDEINSASPGMQLKLLRVLQERKFEPVGSNRTVEVDVRVVLASNQPLEELVAKGLFRQDLYYRINVVSIEVPPLRHRAGDIPTLARHFLALKAADAGKLVTGFSDDALEALGRHPWPGNVRELANVIERAVVLCRRPTITAEDLPESFAADPAAAARARVGVSAGAPSLAGSHLDATPGGAGPDAIIDTPWTPVPLEQALREPERRILLRALHANGWNRLKTAEQLGINRTTLYKKMKLHGIEPGPELAAG